MDGDNVIMFKDVFIIISEEVEKYKLLIEGMVREVFVVFG